MKQLTINPNLIRAGVLAFTLPLFLIGCPQPPEEPPEEPPIEEPPVEEPPEVADRLPEPPPDVQMCPPDCTLTVFLPADPKVAPSVSEEIFRVAGGARVTIELVDQDMERPEESAVTVLKFEPDHEAFVNRGGQPMQRVLLGRGNQQFRARDYADDGPCHPDRGGCKYDVVNKGNPGREEYDPHAVIFP